MQNKDHGHLTVLTPCGGIEAAAAAMAEESFSLL